MNKDEIYNKPIILFFPLQSLTVEENIQASLLLLTVPRCTPLPPPAQPILSYNTFKFTAKNPGQACPSKTVLTQIDGLIIYFIFFPAFYFRNQTWFTMLQLLQGPEGNVENLRLKAEVFSPS